MIDEFMYKSRSEYMEKHIPSVPPTPTLNNPEED